MKLKKIMAIIAATILCTLSTATVYAAGLSSEEQAILNKLKAGVEVDGKVIQVPTQVINQVENELIKNDANITSDQASVIMNKMDEAIAIVQSEGITTAGGLKGSINEILPLVKDAAATIGYTVAYDAAKGDISVADSSGNTVFTTKSIINQTGFDTTALVIISGLFVTLLAACVVMANKKKLFVKANEI